VDFRVVGEVEGCDGSEPIGISGAKQRALLPGGYLLAADIRAIDADRFETLVDVPGMRSACTGRAECQATVTRATR
jgi:hypothetical protein